MGTKERDLRELQMFILDVLCHDDIENLGSILRLLNNPGCIGWREFWPDDFIADEVIPQLRALAAEGQVRALRQTGRSDELEPISVDQVIADERIWFALTDAGREAWDGWNPPTTEDNSSK